LPKTDVEIEINQAIKGGLEKYPKSNLFDQSQYCASSTDNSNGETVNAYIFRKVISISKNKVVDT